MPRSRPAGRNPLQGLASELAAIDGTARAAAGPDRDAGVTAVAPEWVQPAPARGDWQGKRVKLLNLDELWLEHQPRELVPEEHLQRLIVEGRAQPAALLETLTWAAAADDYYAAILEALKGLASSIASQGVLQPIEVVVKAGRYVVRDGHRRSLASLLAGNDSIPAIEVDEPGELEAIARPLILNVQREDLTAIEKGAAILRLALLVARHQAGERGLEDAVPLGIEVLVTAGDDGTGEDEAVPRRDPVTRQLAAAVRDQVCSMVGMSPKRYYQFLALNRLTPEARALGRRMPEGHLRPVTTLPPALQAEVLSFAQRRGLNVKEIGTLAQVARSGDRDAVRRIMARLAREPQPARRSSVSWEPLLHAVPRDVLARCQALDAELRALPPEARQARVEAMRQQVQLLRVLQAEFERLVAEHGAADPPLDDHASAHAGLHV